MTENEQRAAQEEFNKRFAAEQEAQRQLHQQLLDAQRHAAIAQQALNEAPRLLYAAIVAVDERGAFSKEGQIPWHYPEDFKWFKTHTTNQICVMGRTTYDGINTSLGDKAQESVLPKRKCFVVTSSPLPRPNATVLSSLRELEQHLTDDDQHKTIFICGGERLYSEGIAKCNRVFVTVVNKDVDGDRFFPVNYLQKHFSQTKVFKVDTAPDLRFTIWDRT